MKFDELYGLIKEDLNIGEGSHDNFLPEGPQTVTENGKEIGELEFDVVKNSTKESILGYFTDYGDIDNDDPIIKYIRSLRLPKSFTYIWIQLLKVSPKQRGKGKGSKILKALFKKYPRNVLFALSPREIAQGRSNLENVIRFYEKNGFEIIRSKTDMFAFKNN